ncbi:unnamed protein product [Penicillium salamii]|uniref:Uncharacterized protein n=1 Tax=Penicillium salamii TaxID=1612424 RepID=A0A9W4JTG6_9EURO|nr:unnamed protein product [Penicillium salamii]CAG8418840.1 unnamed protein product [Penicillium salamii]CAG8419374.1 unnamed protein product [Penicillium salamii]CAG8555975.1 unnamed protein product [Penicillium salamii]
MLGDNIVRAPTTYTQGSRLSSQQLRVLSDLATETHVPWEEERRHLTSNIPPSTTLNASPTAQRLDKNSSLPPLYSETATETFISNWSDTRSTNMETVEPTTTYLKVDNELGRSELVYQDSQNFSTPCCLNSLVATDTAEPGTGIQSMLQPTEFGINDSHDATGSSGVVSYSAETSALPLASLQITPTLDWVFESSNAHAPVVYPYQGTSQEMQYGGSQAKAKKVGNYMGGNPKLLSDWVRYSQGLMSSQTVQERPEASDIGFIRPTSITINSSLHPTSAESITTTARKEPTMDNTRVSRAVPTHILGLVFGCISGLSLVFGIVFFAHRVCVKRAFSPRRETDSKKAACVAAKHLSVSENMEISRFSAYS